MDYVMLDLKYGSRFTSGREAKAEAYRHGMSQEWQKCSMPEYRSRRILMCQFVEFG